MLRAAQTVIDERSGQADPDRPAGGHRAAAPSGSACACGRAATSSWSIPERPALQRLLGRLSRADGAARRRDPDGAQHRAHPPDRDRGADGAARRGRRHARRRLRPLPTHFNHVRDVIGLREGAKHMAALSMLVMPTPLAVPRRHLRQPRSRRRDARRDHPAGGRAVLRFGIEPKVALLSHSQLRQPRASLGAQDGRGAGDPAQARARRSRSTARCTATPRSIRRSARACSPARAQGRGQPGDLPSLDAANIAFNLLARGRRPAYRPDPARHRAARAHPDAVGDGARHRQHDGARRRRGAARSPRRGG